MDFKSIIISTMKNEMVNDEVEQHEQPMSLKSIPREMDDFRFHTLSICRSQPGLPLSNYICKL